MAGKLPDTRRALTHKFKVADHEGYITVGLYEDGTPGEVFIKMSKQGSTISGLLETVSILTSLALQGGVPLESIVSKLSHMRFEPSGFTGTEFGFATSVVDYIFRWIGTRFLATPEEEGTAPAGPDAADAPVCRNCGGLTVPSGACHCCPQCGTSSGCS